MDLPSSSVIDILEARGVTEIYHANSVLTSTQFLRNHSLLSRGTIERRKLFQTEQKSDGDDKKYSLWFDVFTDTVDIHQRTKTANLYGPVLFVLGVDKIKAMYKGRLWITKLNPVHWAGKSENERWFRSIEELDEHFSVGTFNQMIVFRHSGGELPINTCLTKIILDDPGLVLKNKSQFNIASMAYGALKISMKEGNVSVPIKIRDCNRDCKCREKFEDKDFVKKMFFP